MPLKIWCEHCHDHFDKDHYNTEDHNHGIGSEYGPYGELLFKVKEYDRLKKFIQWLEWRLYLAIGGQANKWELEKIKEHLNESLPFEAPE